MIFAFDVYYYDKKAKVVAIGFEEWNSEKTTKIFSKIIDSVEEYKSGEFYKRELPCILELMKEIDINTINIIIIDGYVHLDDFGKLGLGGYLYKALNEKIPIIGVAKTNFYQNKENSIKLFRGKSRNPLNITSIGIDLEIAAQYVFEMNGNYRIPTLLKYVDRLTKE